MKQHIFKRRLRLVFFAVYLAGFFWYLRTYLSDGRQAAIVIVGALLLGITVGLVVRLFRLKSVLVRAFGTDSIRDGRPDEFPLLDGAELERLTLAWEALGFERSSDRAGNANNARDGSTFTRILEHREQGALAEISQTFGRAKVLPFTAAAFSFWGEREPIFEAANRLKPILAAPPLPAPTSVPVAENPVALEAAEELWMLVTHNRAPNKFWKLMERGRTVSRRMEASATPDSLWRAHLQQRADVEARLNQPHLRGDLDALLRAHGLVLRAQLGARLQRTSAWKFAAAYISLAQLPAHHDGELPALTAQTHD